MTYWPDASDVVLLTVPVLTSVADRSIWNDRSARIRDRAGEGGAKLLRGGGWEKAAQRKRAQDGGRENREIGTAVAQ